MGEASVRELRNQGGRVLDRVLSGEQVTITRDGAAVAALVPLMRRPMSVDAVVARFEQLPPMDPERLRRDVDDLLEQRL